VGNKQENVQAYYQKLKFLFCLSNSSDLIEEKLQVGNKQEIVQANYKKYNFFFVNQTHLTK
jgi:hypothetical protein